MAAKRGAWLTAKGDPAPWAPRATAAATQHVWNAATLQARNSTRAITSVDHWCADVGCDAGDRHSMPSRRHVIADGPLFQRFIGTVCKDVEGAEVAWEFFAAHSR